MIKHPENAAWKELNANEQSLAELKFILASLYLGTTDDMVRQKLRVVASPPLFITYRPAWCPLMDLLRTPGREWEAVQTLYARRKRDPAYLSPQTSQRIFDMVQQQVADFLGPLYPPVPPRAGSVRRPAPKPYTGVIL